MYIVLILSYYSISYQLYYGEFRFSLSFFFLFFFDETSQVKRVDLTLYDSLTCGKHSFLGEGLVVYDGELGQFDVLHPSD